MYLHKPTQSESTMNPKIDRESKPGKARQGLSSRGGVFRSAIAVLAFALLLGACGGGTASKSGKSGTVRDGGSVVFAAEQEPDVLNILTTPHVWTAITTAPVLSSLLTYGPDMDPLPQLLSELPQLVSESPQRVQYKLRPEAKWDDGSPITSDDVQFTLSAILDESNDIATRDGYKEIKDGKLTDVSADKKSFVIEYKQPFAAWMNVFAVTPILKKAYLEGEDFNTALNDTLPFASGPFKFKEWNRKTSLTLARNENYWGQKAHLDEVTFKFILDSGAELRSLQGDEAQIAFPKAQTDTLGELERMPDVDFQNDAGLVWQHISFNNQNPMLSSKEVRQALAYMMDRKIIVERIAKPSNPNVGVLQNVFYVPTQPEYRPAFDVYKQDYNKASELLKSAGFSKGSTGVWEKGGKPLELKISTTGGDKARELIESILVEQFSKGGVKLTTNNYPGTQLFAPVKACQYDLALYAYQTNPDPIDGNSVFSGDAITCPGPNQAQGGQNQTGYNNPKVTALLNQANGELNQQKRADLYNEANAIIAGDAPVIPLFQQSLILAFNTRVHGLKNNPTSAGPTWNTQDWWIEQ